MKITLLLIGKTDEEYLQKGIARYEERVKHYSSFEIIVVPGLKNTKNLAMEQQKQKEAEQILKYIIPGNYIVLLDENGKEMNSVDFSVFLQKQINNSIKNLIFIIGGPYGFSEDVKKKASNLLSLSQMTFSHQLVRLIFCEQLYRAFTILKNEPYHHE